MSGYRLTARISGVLIMLLASAAPVAAWQTADSTALIGAGRALTQQLFAGDAESLYPRLTPELQQLMGGEAGIAQGFGQRLGEGGFASPQVTGEDDDVSGTELGRHLGREVAGCGEISELVVHHQIQGLWMRGTRQPMRVTSS